MGIIQAPWESMMHLYQKNINEKQGTLPNIMTEYRKSIRQTLRGETPDTLVWQPRLSHWYWSNRLGFQPPSGSSEDDSYVFDPSLNHRPFDGNVPSKYNDLSLMDIYHMLDASVRKPGETLGLSLFETEVTGSEIEREIQQVENDVITKYDTPAGSVKQVMTWGHPHNRFIQGIDDLERMIHVMEGTKLSFIDEAYQVADQVYGERGIVQPWSFRSPFMMFMVEWAGFEQALYLLNDHPDEVEEFLSVAEEEWEQKLDMLIASPLEVVSFAENVDAAIISPTLYKKYLLPYYQRAVDRIHDAGMVCHAHFDGNLKTLLPYIGDAGFDAIEAATPEPQGDVSVSELKDAMDDTVLVDGIPATLFTSEYPREELKETTIEILDKFYPHIILGISDMLPPDGDIERLVYVTEIVEKYRSQNLN